MNTGVIVEEQLIAAWNEHQRPLVGLATTILKDPSAAEDAVQEAFLRLAFQANSAIDDVRGWLIVVVTRLCIDHLRSAQHRREAPVRDEIWPEPQANRSAHDPAELVVAMDDLRTAVVTLLTRLSPSEQAAFVLHDVFQMPFEQVADALQRSPEACRQLASRARRGLETRGPAKVRLANSEVDAVTERFVAACQGGKLEELLEVLAPDVVGVAEFGRLLPKRTLRGRARVAGRLRRLFARRRFTLVPTELERGPAVVVVRRRDAQIVGVLFLTVEGAQIVHINATNDPREVASLRSK
jgi:RNA polymerase sigma-70 factor (ECF subfamily)